jgi:hypothetical protein
MFMRVSKRFALGCDALKNAQERTRAQGVAASIPHSHDPSACEFPGSQRGDSAPLREAAMSDVVAFPSNKLARQQKRRILSATTLKADAAAQQQRGLLR